jgi:MFS family permease
MTGNQRVVLAVQSSLCDEGRPAVRCIGAAGGKAGPMTTQSENAPSRSAGLSAAAIVLFGTLSTLYMVSQFLRTSVGVIAPDLAAELHLSAAQIGLLSSAFFFVFALAQLPLGVAFDRFGPKRCLLVCAVIVVLGIVVFAGARSATGLTLGRALLGLGAASFLMAPLAIYARWFARERFSTLAGLQIGVGTIGTLLSTAPLAFLVALVGWRASFLMVGAFTVAIALLVLIVVRNDPPGVRSAPRRESLRESLAGLIEAICMPSMVRLFVMQLAIYSSFVLVVGLWGGPYLTHIYGYDLKGRGELLLIAAMAHVVGAIVWGPTDRLFNRYKPVALFAATLCAVTLLVPAVVGTLTPTALVVWLLVLGFSSAVIPVVLAHGRALLPTHLIGRGITFLNTGTIGGVFISQLVSGAVIDLFPSPDGAYSLDAYRLIFALQAAFLVMAGLVYFGSQEPRREAN